VHGYTLLCAKSYEQQSGNFERPGRSHCNTGWLPADKIGARCTNTQWCSIAIYVK